MFAHFLHPPATIEISLSLERCTTLEIFTRAYRYQYDIDYVDFGTSKHGFQSSVRLYWRYCALSHFDTVDYVAQRKSLSLRQCHSKLSEFWL